VHRKNRNLIGERSTRNRERRASAGRGAGTGSAKALPRLFGRLPPVCWGTLLQSRPPNHSGLTPAALVHVRLCIAKIAISSARDLHATRSGARQPAVRIRRHICNGVRRRIVGSRVRGSAIVFATAIPHIFADRHRAANPRAAGVSSPWCAIIALAGECAFRRSMHAVVWEPDLQRHYRDYSGDCPRCVRQRGCNRLRVTTAG